MIIYKAHKEQCYVKNLEIKDNIVKVNIGFRLQQEESYFYKNFLGVIIDISTGSPLLSQIEAWESVQQRAKLRPNNSENIICNYIDEGKLIPVKNIKRKELKKIRQDIKSGQFNI